MNFFNDFLKIKLFFWSKLSIHKKCVKIKGEPGIARARLPARPRAENRAIWQNQVPVARTSVTGHARARPLPGL